MTNGKTLTGIDIGAGRVSVAQLIAGEGAPRVLCAFSAEIPAGPEPHSRRAAATLKSLLRDNNIRASKLAAILPDRDVMFRAAILPAATAEELQGMARLEMEYISMLPPGQLNVACRALGPRLPGGYRAGVSAASKTAVASLVETLKSAGLSPDAITTGGAAAAQYFSPGVKDNEAALAIHGDPDGASIYIVTSLGLAMSHRVPAGAHAAAIDGIIAGARLCAEQAGVEQPSSVLLFGDTSSLPTAAAIEKALGIPATVSDGAEYITDGSLKHAQRAAGAALELAADASAGANLLSSGADAAAKAAFNSALARAASAAAAIIAVAAFAISASAFQSQNRALEQAASKISALEPRVKQMEKKRSALRSLNLYGEKQQGCLDIMLELSRVLPQDIYVTSLVFDKGNSISVAGEAKSQMRVAAAIQTLENSTIFKNTQLAYSRQTDAQGGAIVAFEIKASLSEDAAQ